MATLSITSTPCCPECKSDDSVSRIKRTYLVRHFLPFLPLKRYYCYQCVRTFWKLKRTR